METKFTPGPWEAVKVNITGTPELSGSIFKGRARICCGLYDDIRLREEADANIRLIAAAPDMYEALKGVLVAASHHLDAYDSDRDFTEATLKERMATARASLAKAIGEVDDE